MTECLRDTRVVFYYYWIYEKGLCELVPYSEQQCCVTINQPGSANFEDDGVPVVESHRLLEEVAAPPELGAQFKRFVEREEAGW